MRRKAFILVAFLTVLAFAASCSTAAPKVESPIPTKTPKPTFTPTPNWTPTPLVIPTATPLPATATPAASPTPSPVPATATPEGASISAGQKVNVRSGPGTTYAIIGQLAAGQTAVVSGKNADGSWYEFAFNGDVAWVSASLVSVTGNTGAIALAQNIPAPPPTARPQPTAVRQPTAAPPPPAPPKPQYKYSRASVASCRPQAGGTWFNGYVRMGGQAVDGVSVVFSWGPDAAPVASVPSGPHPGYDGWDHGYFSHIVNDTPGRPRAGDWYVWVTEGGQRVSEIVKWHSDGPVAEGTGCNDATINFEG